MENKGRERVKEFVMEPRLRASPDQFFVLIDFMERHGDLSKPEPGPQARIKSDELWQELANKLNTLGGGVQKTVDKWKKAWADWKTKTKKKYLSIRKQASTAGGANLRIALTTLEERVVAVIGVSAVLGQDGVPEQGSNNAPSETVSESNSAIEASMAHANALGIALQDQSQNIGTPASSPSPSSSPSRSPARSNRRQGSASPQWRTSRRALFRARRSRGVISFARVANRFAVIEQRRLEYEEARDKRFHEREMERLRLEAERIEVTREHNSLLHRLSLLGQNLIDVITQQRPLDNFPSTSLI